MMDGTTLFKKVDSVLQNVSLTSHQYQYLLRYYCLDNWGNLTESEKQKLDDKIQKVLEKALEESIEDLDILRQLEDVIKGFNSVYYDKCIPFVQIKVAMLSESFFQHVQSRMGYRGNNTYVLANLRFSVLRPFFLCKNNNIDNLYIYI